MTCKSNMNGKTMNFNKKLVLTLLVFVAIKFALTYFIFPSWKLEDWFMQLNDIMNVLLVVCATCLLFRTVRLVCYNRIELDRILSEGKWQNVFHVVAFILSIPLFVYGIIRLLSYIPCCRVRFVDLLGDGFIESPGLLWTVFYYLQTPEISTWHLPMWGKCGL